MRFSESGSQGSLDPVKWVAVSCAVVLLALAAAALVRQQREISSLQRDLESQKAAVRAAALGHTPVSRWGYDFSAEDAAPLVATLCSIPTDEAEALRDLQSGRIAFLLTAFANGCEPRRHR